MAPRRRERLVPCINCREKHTRCDGATPCAYCQKTNSPCVPARKQRPFRFKPVLPDAHASSSKARQAVLLSHPSGPRETTLARQSRTGEDSLAEAARILQTLTDNPSTALEGDRDPAAFGSPNSSGHAREPSEERDSPELGSHTSIAIQAPSYSTPREQHSHVPSSFLADEPVGFALGDSCSPSFVSPESSRVGCSHWPNNSNGSPQVLGSESSPGFQEACLVRCFVDHLADAFDTTDQYRAYKTIVPQEAKKRPLLLNAICTAAAGYLTILQSAQDPEGMVHYNGIPLPDLNKESTIHYHNTCIAYMIDYLNHPWDPLDDVLIAIPILRYHEQVDMHLTGSDSETYSNALGAIFRAKQSGFITFLGAIGNSDTNSKEPFSQEFAMRRSACLIALRQEITGVLLYRRPFRLSLPANYYRSLASSQKDKYDDYDWTNYVIVWCAYVLKHYYGSENDADAAENSQTKAEQLQSLKAFEQQWELLSPNPLNPFFYKERDPERGQFFPIIWQSNDNKVIGMQLLEFGRIVLAVHDQKQHILGLGAAAAARAMENKLRQSTRIICGLALSHRIQPAMTGACTAISLCGEYFHDPGEQAAIAELMATIERDYAWSTSSVMESLKRTWSSSRRDSGDKVAMTSGADV
ncbi:hypothetical protein F5Y10DRAFT_183793 [Nemania abortiva]|nr:hypothetical protein F5Y10DRAFT_183793 [Nemania abortiva]